MNTATGYRVKDDEGLTALHLLIALFRAHHLSSNGNAKIFSCIAEIARGRRDYSLAVYALLQAQDYQTDDWQELKKPVVRLWKSIVKCVGHKYRTAHLSLLRRRFADAVSDLDVPGDFQEQMLSGDKGAEALNGALEVESMREAEGRSMGLGSEEGLIGKMPCC